MVNYFEIVRRRVLLDGLSQRDAGSGPFAQDGGVVNMPDSVGVLVET